MGVCASSRKAKEGLIAIAVDNEIIDDSDEDPRGVDDSERQEEVQPELEHDTDKEAIKVNDTMLIDLADDILTLINRLCQRRVFPESLRLFYAVQAFDDRIVLSCEGCCFNENALLTRETEYDA